MTYKEADIRKLLYDYLDERYGKIRTFEELYIGDTRADIYAVTDDSIIGIEIKGDTDSYERLKKQVRDYDRYCDLCYAAVGPTKVHVSEHIPEWWGILAVDCSGEEAQIVCVREASPGGKTSFRHQLSVLWKRELYALREMHGLGKSKSESKKAVIDKFVKLGPEENVLKNIRDILFERDYTVFEKTGQAKKSRPKHHRSTAARQRAAIRRKKRAAR